ncbi:hypothetical protein FRC12_005487 [Ceratobasidium sp. 428]|nr:hypothetical protein FRC12_005487 [Ceratobasidium sp. 428]
MAQVATRFAAWLESYRSIPLSDFQIIATEAPDVLDAVVTVVGCHGASYRCGYLLVECYPVSRLTRLTTAKLTFRLQHGKSLSNNNTDLDYPHEKYEPLSPGITIRRESEVERPPFFQTLFRGSWEVCPPVVTVNPRDLKLKHILAICEQLTRRDPVFLRDTLGASVHGPGWIYPALLECLRGCWRCFGGSILVNLPYVSTWDGWQEIIQAKVKDYLEENHPDCLIPVPKPPIPLRVIHPENYLLDRNSITEETNQALQCRASLSGSTKPPRNLLEIADTLNDGDEIPPLRVNELGSPLPPSICTYRPRPEAVDAELYRQAKENFELRAIQRSRKQMALRATSPKRSAVVTKRRIGDMEEVERSKAEGNKRTKVAYGEVESLVRPLVMRENETEPSAISKAMSLPVIVSLLAQHGCRDVTQMLDLPACSEYPTSSGGFGDVFQGKLGSVSVAIKCMRIVVDPHSSEQKAYLKSAAREIHTWSKLNHRYVSKLLGLAQFRGQIAMVSPWAEHGALPGFLTRQPQQNRPRLASCAQIADGLAFLHEHKMVHGDLKGANILISKNYEPLLTDFGNAILHDRSLQFTYTTAKSNFSVRWTSPEVLDGGPCSFEADVYALGMTILEVITGVIPYAGLRDMAVMNSVNNKRHPKRPDEHIPTSSVSGEALWSMLSRCWAFEPKSRPPVQWVQDVVSVILFSDRICA